MFNHTTTNDPPKFEEEVQYTLKEKKDLITSVKKVLKFLKGMDLAANLKINEDVDYYHFLHRPEIDEDVEALKKLVNKFDNKKN